MKLNRKIVIIVSSMVLIFVIVFSTTFVIYQNRKIEPGILTDHEPIIILNDKDFKNFKFPGRGTENNPYLIQYYNITTDHSESIYISGTTKHFVIQNCYLNSYYTNIYIENSNGSVQIFENEIEGALQGINILDSPGTKIKGNNISVAPSYIEIFEYYLFSSNIELINCEHSLISHNTLTNGTFNIFDSEYVTIDKNEFYLRRKSDYPGGAVFDIESDNTIITGNYFDSEKRLDIDSDNVIVSENIFVSDESLVVWKNNITISRNIFKTDGYISIHGDEANISDNLFESGGYIYGLDGADNAKITGNEFEDGGLIEIKSLNSIISSNSIINGGYAIYDASSTVENNLVNDKELGYFVDLEDEIFTSDTYGQYIFIECMNLTIRDLNVRNTSYGIFIASSNNITVLNNDLSYTDVGIVAVDSINIDITDNFLNHSGILGGCDNSSIANNIGYDCPIFVGGSFVTIENNTLRYPENAKGLLWWNGRSYGIRLQSGSNNVVQHNILEYGDFGILCDDPQDSIFYNNTVNFVKIGIIILTDYFSTSYNITMDNNSINATQTSIQLGYCKNFVISNNVMSTGIDFGGTLSNYETLTVVNNTINGRLLGFYTDAQNLILSSPEFATLYLINCSNSIISNQVIENSATKIMLVSCNNVTITNCSFTNSSGLNIFGSSNCIVKNNTLWNSAMYLAGISNCTILENSCYDSYYVLHVRFSVDCTITNNTFANGDYGIYVAYSSNCTIKYNLIISNSILGISLFVQTENITIHHNAFIDNGEYEGSQAEDYGENNIFYDVNSLEGNFWSNWISGPYSIAGSAGSEDPYPLASNPL